MEKYRHLSFASSLCGRCTEVCPVRIDVHKLLMLNRRDVSVADQVPKMESRIVYFWKKAMLNRKLMEMGGSSIKNMAMKYMLKGSWGKHREVPRIAPKSFSRLWREKKGMF